MNRHVTPLNAGDVVDGLVVEAELGRGGTSIVYRVRHKRSGERFALKQLVMKCAPDELESRVQAFYAEGKRTSSLTHPNVLSCIKQFEDKGRAFLLFPYVQGESLLRHLNRIQFDGTMPLSRVLHLGQQLLELGTYLSSRNLNHGDIKPANLLLSDEDELKLLDFGSGRDKQNVNLIQTRDADQLALLSLFLLLLTGESQLTRSQTAWPKRVSRDKTRLSLALAIQACLENSHDAEDKVNERALSTLAHQVKSLAVCCAKPDPLQDAPTLILPVPRLMPSTSRRIGRKSAVFAIFLLVVLATIWWGGDLLPTSTTKKLTALADNAKLVQPESIDNVPVKNEVEPVKNELAQSGRSEPESIPAAGIDLQSPAEQEQTRDLTAPVEENAAILPELNQPQAHEETVHLHLHPIVQALLDDLQAIPEGAFTMGSVYGRANETPVFQVTLPTFAIMKHEFSVNLYRYCVEAKACHAPGGERLWQETLQKQELPVTGVSFAQIYSEFLPWLNSLSNHKFALPDEAQWEYAARGQTQTEYYWGEEVHSEAKLCAGCDGKKRGRGPLVSGQYPANPFGLFDTLGNVAEMVDACWTENYHEQRESGIRRHQGHCERVVVRGGAWRDSHFDLRVASRASVRRLGSSSQVGFRLVLVSIAGDKDGD